MKEAFQVGVMGSMSDTELGLQSKEVAQELGTQIANNKAVLVYGFEGDFNSLPAMAAKAAEKEGGITIAFFWGQKGADLGELKSLRIETGMLRGGGREFSLVLSCDGIICIGGGSGTLTEIAMAYQAKIPIVVLEKTGGWSEKLAGEFLDGRKKIRILSAGTPKEAVEILLSKIQK